MVFVDLHISRAFHSFASLVRRTHLAYSHVMLSCTISFNSQKNEKAVPLKCQSRIFQSHNLIYCSLSALWHFIFSLVFVKFVSRCVCRSRFRFTRTHTHTQTKCTTQKCICLWLGKSLSAAIRVRPRRYTVRNRHTQREREGGVRVRERDEVKNYIRRIVRHQLNKTDHGFPCSPPSSHLYFDFHVTDTFTTQFATLLCIFRERRSNVASATPSYRHRLNRFHSIRYDDSFSTTILTKRRRAKRQPERKKVKWQTKLSARQRKKRGRRSSEMRTMNIGIKLEKDWAKAPHTIPNSFLFAFASGQR